MQRDAICDIKPDLKDQTWSLLDMFVDKKAIECLWITKLSLMI